LKQLLYINIKYSGHAIADAGLSPM